MPGPFDFFSPGWPQEEAPQATPQGPGLLSNPRAQAALLQAGLSLMAGPTWGDTPSSQIARAIGSAGEAVSRGEAEDLKQREADSKAGLREAQANAAQARAETAGARSGTAASNLELARERLGIARANIEGRQERAMLSGRIRLSGMYQQYLRDVAKQNADPLRTAPPIVPVGMNDWIKQNPTLRTLGLVPDETTPGDGADNEPLPAATPNVSGAPSSAPKIGETRKGYRFRGGDPSKPENWEKV